MESNLFIELSQEQQEVVAGGLTLESFDSASFFKESAGIAQGAKADKDGASTYGIATADYTSTFASKNTYINPFFFSFPI